MKKSTKWILILLLVALVAGGISFAFTRTQLLQGSFNAAYTLEAETALRDDLQVLIRDGIKDEKIDREGEAKISDDLYEELNKTINQALSDGAFKETDNTVFGIEEEVLNKVVEHINRAIDDGSIEINEEGTTVSIGDEVMDVLAAIIQEAYPPQPEAAPDEDLAIDITPGEIVDDLDIDYVAVDMTIPEGEDIGVDLEPAEPVEIVTDVSVAIVPVEDDGITAIPDAKNPGNYVIPDYTTPLFKVERADDNEVEIEWSSGDTYDLGTWTINAKTYFEVTDLFFDIALNNPNEMPLAKYFSDIEVTIKAEATDVLKLETSKKTYDAALTPIVGLESSIETQIFTYTDSTQKFYVVPFVEYTMSITGVPIPEGELTFADNGLEGEEVYFTARKITTFALRTTVEKAPLKNSFEKELQYFEPTEPKATLRTIEAEPVEADLILDELTSVILAATEVEYTDALPIVFHLDDEKTRWAFDYEKGSGAYQGTFGGIKLFLKDLIAVFTPDPRLPATPVIDILVPEPVEDVVVDVAPPEPIEVGTEPEPEEVVVEDEDEDEPEPEPEEEVVVEDEPEEVVVIEDEPIADDTYEILTDEDYICADIFVDRYGLTDEELICRMWRALIVIGRSEFNYVPAGISTRAEWAKVIVKSLGYVNSDGESLDNVYSDVGTGDWYYNYVKIAYDLDIISLSDGYFRPNEPISRRDAAVMITNSTNFNLPSEGETFSDVSESDYGYDAIVGLHNYFVDTFYGEDQAIVSGFSDGTYQPDDYFSRTEMAVLALRAYVAFWAPEATDTY